MTKDTEGPLCELCGEPMPPGEEMFKYHGYSGPCPKPHIAPVGGPTNERIRELWRSVQGPHAELTGPLIRFASLLFEAGCQHGESNLSTEERARLSWRCFHCDEVFTDKEEAREHFGADYDVDPACAIKADEGGLVGEIRRLEAELQSAYNQRNEYENDARLWHEAEADRIRRIGHVQWWQELDYREGEKLVLRERAKALEAQVERLSLERSQP